MSACALWILGWIAIGVEACGTNTEERMYSMKHMEGEWDLLGRAARLGLRASEHFVRTEDGYVLSVIRVHGKKVSGPPMLLMHGLQHSATGWLDAGNGSPAALLAAAGHDLWLGNARGSYLSRRHAWLCPDTDPSYWQFSADEIGRFDLPALIDYILDTTGSDKLDYMGLSQGGTIFFIMCSERPEYRHKVSHMIGLAPATRMLHTTSIPFKLFTGYYKSSEETLHNVGIWEALPYGGIFQITLKSFCEFSIVTTKACQVFVGLLAGLNPGSITLPVFRTAVATIPAGSSVHNMAWFGQLVKSDHFRKFDYGPEQNLVHYGSRTAPAYNLSAATLPTVIMYGRNDAVVDVRDIDWLVKKLPNVRKVYEMEDPMWNHLDFVFSKNIPNLLYPKIEETLRWNSL